ncbi:MAG: AzlD domain-containing protein [Oscillospiraceae bacterium]|nr:AzlD domain-containing protein [Oscillospiraceae bacterium]
MGEGYLWAAVAVMALVTALLRFLPFLLWGSGGEVPKPVAKLGRVLPCAIMGMLVVYCLKEVRLTDLSGWLPSLIACAVVAGLHIWRRNTLLSILGGTVCYMLLVQLVFS